MQVDLQSRDPLSQVVFIFDYLQIYFQDAVFTIYNLATYAHGSVTIRQGEPGFCDSLVALIGQTARVQVHPEMGLIIRFHGGASITVSSSDPNACGPEAWNFCRSNGPLIVNHNT